MSLQGIILGYAAACAAFGLYTLLQTGLNTTWLYFTSLLPSTSSGPTVSVLIPARDEAANIGACIESLMVQNYDSFEIIIYDDDSSDGTGAIIERYARLYPGFIKALHGRKLPKGWYGKPHALQKLSEAAEGEWLLFTDADTVHSPDSIGAVMARAKHFKADLVTGYIRHDMPSFGEASVVPAIYILTMLGVPLWLVHLTKTPMISHAIGQYMCFRASAYKALGGYSAVQREVSEDIRIARLLKKNGGKVVFSDLKQYASCRMYKDYASAMAGISKNVFDYMNKNFAFLLAATIAVPLLFFVPILCSIWMPESFHAARNFFLAHFMMMFYSWCLVVMERMLPWYVPFVYPVILVNVLSLAWRACRLFLTGKAIEWKGRMVK